MNHNAFVTIAQFIVNKRKLFYLLFLIAIVFSVVSIPKVKVNYDIASYLPDNNETKMALSVMDDEFTTFGTAEIMVSNITINEANKLYEEFQTLELVGLKSVAFEDSDDYFKNSSARFVFTFSAPDGSDEATTSIEMIKSHLSGYDTAVLAVESSSAYASSLQKDMTVILIIAVLIVLIMLILSSKSYMEIPIFLIIFGTAAILNMGTNFWFGEISFISKSVAIILQLTLAIDYAIILSHRFMQEKENTLCNETAVVNSLSKAIPEILSSSLTTVAGLIAIMFMQIRIGMDLGSVLAKGIGCSLLSVFILMPGLLMLFDKPLDKTKHRTFVPNISGIAKIIVKSKFILPIIFIMLIGASAFLQSQNQYVFSQNAIDPVTKTQNRLDKENIQSVFGVKNTLAVLIPAGDFDKEREVLAMIENKPMVNSSLGLANVQLSEGIYLTDHLTIRQFASVVEMERSTAQWLYIAYALVYEEYKILNIDDYRVPLLNMIEFLNTQINDGLVSLSPSERERFDKLYMDLSDAKLQLLGKNYSRLIFNIDGEAESPETFALLQEIRNDLSLYYQGGLLVGESTSSYDLFLSFASDNKKIGVLTILFILIILLFTFKSVGAPIILLLIIQGSIWINFALPVLFSTNLFFFSFLIVSTIQMGATIDYAIVLTNRFHELKLTLGKEEAAISAMNQCFPTIITSGAIMTIAGFLIGYLVADPIISSIGLALGRGTLISLLSVMVILPQVLIIGSDLIDKTVFKVNLDNLGINGNIFKNKRFQLIINSTKKETKISEDIKNEKSSNA